MPRTRHVFPSRSRQLWDPRGLRRRGRLAPLKRKGPRRVWFWPECQIDLERRRQRWARLRSRLVGRNHEPTGPAPQIETKSARVAVTPEWRWPDFTPSEMACRHCGERHHWPGFMDTLQTARDRIGRPFRILSAHRCALHNARVGGAPRSQHLRLAVDILLAGHDRDELHRALREAGFTGFGFYQTFIHADMGRARFWYGSERARRLWHS